MPASSANLGPGFDTLALALDLRLVAEATWSEDRVNLHDYSDPLAWWREAVEPFAKHAGTLSDLALGTAPNIFASAFVKAVLRAGPMFHLPARLTYMVDSEIPIAQGLGSSAAAAVAGAALAEYWRTGGVDHGEVFQDAVEIEGHPDNAAAATYGGLQAALLVRGQAQAAAQSIHDAVRVALCVPLKPLKQSTHDSRGDLPEQLARADAVKGQRAMLTLLYGLQHADAPAVEAVLDDCLHVPYRKSGIPGFADVVAAAQDAGAWGCTISGAGGSMIALGSGDMTRVAGAMRDAFLYAGVEAVSLTPEIDRRGLIVGPV